MPINIIDKVLKLSKKEKVKLYYALQQDLDFDDDYLGEEDLSPKQWKELNKRIRDVESGKTTLIPWAEFKKQLDEKTEIIRNKHIAKHTG
jgi:putative addiction module component (TIGR02574 family)